MRKLPIAAGLLLVALSAQAGGPPKFPDIELQGQSGEAVRLSQFRGNVVLMNFWATWCGPCRMELPKLQDLYNRYSDRKFVVFAVNVDDDRRLVEGFLKKNNLTIPVYFTDPMTANMMTSQGIPTSVIIAPDGTLEKAYVGYEPNIEDSWMAHIDRYLKKGKPSKAGRSQ